MVRVTRKRRGTVKIAPAITTQLEEIPDPDATLTEAGEKLNEVKNQKTKKELKPLGVQHISGKGKNPTRRAPYSAEVKLFVSEDYVIPGRAKTLMKTDIQITFTSDHTAVITGNSDALSRYGLEVDLKIIVPNNLEEITFQVTNVTDEEVTIAKHTSLAILSLHRTSYPEIVVLNPVKPESNLGGMKIFTDEPPEAESGKKVEESKREFSPEQDEDLECKRHKPCPKSKKKMGWRQSRGHEGVRSKITK